MKTPSIDPSTLTFLAGGGEMGARMREMDWSRTALGPPAAVAAEPSQHRQHAASVEGADHPVLGSRVHRLLQRCVPSGVRRQASCTCSGCPGREAWSEIWDSMLHDAARRRGSHRRSVLGARICCSTSSATDSSRRPTSTSPTIRCASNPARSAASSASSPRRPSGSSASGGWRC